MNSLPPTLITALLNEELRKYESQGHLTACKACGKMMYHNMSGSSEDLCWIDLGEKGSVSTKRVYLCRTCLGQVKAEMKSMKT